MINQEKVRQILLDNCAGNVEAQRYFTLFLRVEKLLAEEKERWLKEDTEYLSLVKKSWLYVDKNAFGGIVVFVLACILANLIIMPIFPLVLGFHVSGWLYGFLTVVSGLGLQTFLALRFRRLSILSLLVQFENSEMSKGFFEKMLDAIPEDRLQDKKDMADIFAKYSYQYNGVKQYKSLLAYKIMNDKSLW